MRIVVSGAGTAGHVSPVLATVDALQRRGSKPEILFIGRPGGIEAELVRAPGLRFVGIAGGKYRRVPGSRWWQKLTDIPSLLLNLRDVFLLVVGTLQALWILGRFRPNAIFNKGGSVGLPVGLAARILNIPMMIHEPDVTPGLGNKTLSRWARKIAVGFPLEHYPQLPSDKLVYTGNPVQPQIFAHHSAATAREQLEFKPNRPVVLVMGGSLGAQALNSAVINVLGQLLELAQVHLISGRLDYERVKQLAEAHHVSKVDGWRLDSFLTPEQMAVAYAAADVVVARAGANTIAELAALAKPTILVPNRLAAAHQLANAEVLVKAGAAELASEDPANLFEAIKELVGSTHKQKALSQAIAGFSAPQAADKLADIFEGLGSKR